MQANRTTASGIRTAERTLGTFQSESGGADESDMASYFFLSLVMSPLPAPLPLAGTSGTLSSGFGLPSSLLPQPVRNVRHGVARSAAITAARKTRLTGWASRLETSSTGSLST